MCCARCWILWPLAKFLLMAALGNWSLLNQVSCWIKWQLSASLQQSLSADSAPLLWQDRAPRIKVEAEPFQNVGSRRQTRPQLNSVTDRCHHMASAQTKSNGSFSHCALAELWNTWRMPHQILGPSNTEQIDVKENMDRSQAKVWAGCCCTCAALVSGPFQLKQPY